MKIMSCHEKRIQSVYTVFNGSTEATMPGQPSWDSLDIHSRLHLQVPTKNVSIMYHMFKPRLLKSHADNQTIEQIRIS